MPVFRNATPARRPNPRTVSDYTSHKEHLRDDFNKRCGYCDDTDAWKTNWFEIDHFVPRDYLITKSDHDYTNLTYSCRSCNNSKRKKWPTGREDLYNQNDEGFIDACDSNYNIQFERCEDGTIVPLTLLGRWMYKTLKLYRRQHEVIWRLEKIWPIIKQIKELSEGPMDNVPPETLIKMVRIQAQFTGYIEELFQS